MSTPASPTDPVPKPPNPASRILLIVFGVVGLVVCIGSIPVVGILAAIAIPNFVAMQLKAKRAEVPANVNGLATAQLAYDAAFDTFVPASSREEAEAELRAGGQEPRMWKGGGAWGTIGWQPDGPVRGAYWVEVDSEEGDFTAHGLCDVDGDGDFAEYVATSESRARMVTPEYVY
ncbi:MAG: hypothetical protein Q8P18_25590 [Pseudomonadota bacterium]|nr:hypothetical protein [Pseudomonadota bacterium]